MTTLFSKNIDTNVRGEKRRIIAPKAFVASMTIQCISLAVFPLETQQFQGNESCSHQHQHQQRYRNGPHMPSFKISRARLQWLSHS